MVTFLRRDDYKEKQPFAIFFKIGVFKNFVIFTGKHLCWSLSLITMLG